MNLKSSLTTRKANQSRHCEEGRRPDVAIQSFMASGSRRPLRGNAIVSHLGFTEVEEQRFQARLKGYAGDACGDCGNFTLVRNGTCLKCDTCGTTTGCS